VFGEGTHRRRALSSEDSAVEAVRLGALMEARMLSDKRKKDERERMRRKKIRCF